MRNRDDDNGSSGGLVRNVLRFSPTVRRYINTEFSRDCVALAQCISAPVSDCNRLSRPRDPPEVMGSTPIRDFFFVVVADRSDATNAAFSLECRDLRNEALRALECELVERRVFGAQRLDLRLLLRGLLAVTHHCLSVTINLQYIYNLQ